MADGYVLLEFNTEGKGRVKCNEGFLEMKYLDFRLESLDLDDDQVYSMLEYQLPKGLKDVLVMVFFMYQSIPSGHGDYWSVDYEDSLNLESFTIVRQDYKEFYRQMVTEDLNIGIGGFDNLSNIKDMDDKNYYSEIVGLWEEFYDEDFVPFVPKLIKTNFFK